MKTTAPLTRGTILANPRDGTLCEFFGFTVEHYLKAGWRLATETEIAEYERSLEEDDAQIESADERRTADRIDGYDRDDIGESPDY